MHAWSRRSVLLASAGLAAACSPPARPSAPPPQPAEYGVNRAGVGRMVTARGRQFYVETVAKSGAPTLLYLHGGPGAGSYDFSVYQGRRLGEHLNVVMFDQRGVLRSQPLADADTCSMRDLVEDTEALRQALGVRAWTILGHSFGGYLALSYALAYPQSVDKVIFENPAISLDSSARELLRGAAEIYAAHGDQTKARACRDAAAANTEARTTWERFGELVNGMPDRNSLYVHGPQKDFFDRLVATSGIPNDYWGRASAHQQKLFAEGSVFQPLLPRLPELTKPALMIHGAFDRVTAPDQMAAFGSGPARQVALFENSAHFVHFEEHERFARVVADFVTS